MKVPLLTPNDIPSEENLEDYKHEEMFTKDKDKGLYDTYHMM